MINRQESIGSANSFKWGKFKRSKTAECWRGTDHHQALQPWIPPHSVCVTLRCPVTSQTNPPERVLLSDLLDGAIRLLSEFKLKQTSGTFVPLRKMHSPTVTLYIDLIYRLWFLIYLRGSLQPHRIISGTGSNFRGGVNLVVSCKLAVLLFCS